MGQPPYGYIKDPANPKRWIVDEEAARVVKRIFAMSLDGVGTDQIASVFEQEHILAPTAYWQSKGVQRPSKQKEGTIVGWTSGTIVKMLSKREYCGDIVNFKTYSKSYKNKKRLPNDPENMSIHMDVHEPIIDRATWEKVQEKRGKTRKRKCQGGEKNMFSGLLVCADCGCNLNYHFNQSNHEIRYFNCSNYNSTKGTCTSTHYIRMDFLEQVILSEIRRLTKFASQYESDFVKAVMGHSQQAVLQEKAYREKELAKLMQRDQELDRLFERLYEDNITGKISDERFERMSASYEKEQAELAETIKKAKLELEKHSSQAMTTDAFIAVVRKYTRAKKLTPRMLNELIQRIEVHQAEKLDGVQVQRLTIHYNCVGTLDIPDEPTLETPKVVMQTRKGVRVAYEPSGSAI